MKLFKKEFSIGSIFLAFLLLYGFAVRSQCTGCTTVITGGSSNFSVNVGQVVCIDPSVTYTGNITLNGGTLCNQGTLTKVTFKKGIFENYGIFRDPNSLAINTNGYLRITNYSSATFSVGTGMSITSSTGDSVAIYNNALALFTSGTGLSSHDVIFKVFNGDNVSFEVATFNVGAAFSIGDATEFTLKNYTNGSFNVAGNLAFNATGNKSIINHGLFNVNNAVSMSGAGNASHLISIINNSNFNVTGNISTAVNNSGVSIINNQGATISTGISLTLSKTTNTLVNYGNLFIGQDFIVQNAKASNFGYVNTVRDIKTNTGSLTNTATEFANSGFLVAGRHFVVQNDGEMINNALVYAANNLQVTGATFTNSTNSQAIASVSVIIQSTASVVNNGTITTLGIIKFVSSTFTNGAEAVLNSGTDLLLQTSSNATNNGTVITNDGFFKLTGSQYTNNNKTIISGEILPQGSSSVTNNGTITTQSNLLVTTSTLTNNNYVFSANNFSLTNSSAVVNNNGFIDVGAEFRNTAATVNLSERSTLRTVNYYNLNNGIINGGVETPNIENYARIFISEFSQSSGYMNNSIVVWEQSFASTASNNGYGFDQVSNGSRISASVVFAMKGTGLGNAPAIICNAFSNIYNISTSGTLTSYCSGSLISVNSQAQQTIVAGNNTITNNVTLSYNSYTWQPGNTVGQTPLLSPNVTTTYTVYATLPNGCVISGTLLIIVNTPAPPTIVYAGTPWTYSSPSALTFPVTLNGPTGGFYSATPAGLNINSSTGLITALGSAYGTYTVSYTTPESGVCYSMYTTTTVVTLIDLDCHLSILPEYIELCNNDQILLTANGGVDGYTWTPSAGLSCTNCASPILTFTNSVTEYTITSTRNGTACGMFVLRIKEKNDCDNITIVGCCFSNYGAGVYVGEVNTHLNVYCNLLNELGSSPPPVTPFNIEKGEFQNQGNINVKLDWIHNAQNNLFVTTEGYTSFFGGNQNIKGNSNTHFNYLKLNGNGIKTIWINEYANSDLDLTSNEFELQNYNFFMKNIVSSIYRTSGFASTGVNGYFSRAMKINSGPTKKYLFPLGIRSSMSTPFRYRPLEMENNSTVSTDEVSANFMNISPSLTTDVVFVNANPNYTNVVTDKAPTVLQLNNLYYHKIKNTILPPLTFTSNLIIRSYYLTVDGAFQSITEWEQNPNANTDWWGTTPGAYGYGIPSTDPGTFGQVYAMTNGLQTFDKKPYALAKSGIYINTTNFGNGNSIITVNAVPSNTTVSNTNTVLTTINANNTTTTATTNYSTTTVVIGGVITSTTTETTGTLVTVTTSSSSTSGGVTTNTVITTTGTVVTITTNTITSGTGGVITTTTSSTSGTVTTITTSTTTPAVGGVFSNTTTSTTGSTTTTTVTIVNNNGNTSTSSSTVTSVTGTLVVVTTQTCITTATLNIAITTCSTQVGNNPVSITSTSTNIQGSGNNVFIPVGGGLNLPYGTGLLSGNNINGNPLYLSPSPVSNDYIINVAGPNECAVNDKIKFTVTQSGSITPTSVLYGLATSNNYLGQLSSDVHTIDNTNSGIILNATPKTILAACVNSISIVSSNANDIILDQNTVNETINVNVPFTPSSGLTMTVFDVFDATGFPITNGYIPVPLNLGLNTVSINHATLTPGVYKFSFNLSAGVINEIVKGQFIVK